MSKFQRDHIPANAKVTGEMVMEMRRLYAEQGWTQRQLCERFDIGVGQVGRILRGESWRRLPTIETDAQVSVQQARVEGQGQGHGPSKDEIAQSLARLQQLLSNQPATAEPNPYSLEAIEQRERETMVAVGVREGAGLERLLSTEVNSPPQIDADKLLETLK